MKYTFINIKTLILACSVFTLMTGCGSSPEADGKKVGLLLAKAKKMSKEIVNIKSESEIDALQKKIDLIMEQAEKLKEQLIKKYDEPEVYSRFVKAVEDASEK